MLNSNNYHKSLIINRQVLNTAVTNKIKSPE